MSHERNLAHLAELLAAATVVDLDDCAEQIALQDLYDAVQRSAWRALFPDRHCCLSLDFADLEAATKNGWHCGAGCVRDRLDRERGAA